MSEDAASLRKPVWQELAPLRRAVSDTGCSINAEDKMVAAIKVEMHQQCQVRPSLTLIEWQFPDLLSVDGPVDIRALARAVLQAIAAEFRDVGMSKPDLELRTRQETVVLNSTIPQRDSDAFWEATLMDFMSTEDKVVAAKLTYREWILEVDQEVERIASVYWPPDLHKAYESGVDPVSYVRERMLARAVLQTVAA